LSIELREIRWVIVASQHRSLRQAAETLNIRQSTLSRRLRDLEYRLGAVLFERTPGGTRPTLTGQEFIETARRIVAETDTALSRLKARYRGESGGLTIGICAALSTGNLRVILMDYRRRFPDVEVRTVDGPRVRLLSDLAANAIDVAIMMVGGPNWADRMLPLWNERVVVALPESHSLCTHKIVRWAELADEHWLVNRRDPGPEFHELLITKLGCSGLGHVIQHDVGVDRLLSLVGTGLGVTLVAEGATGATYPGVVYREVHGEAGPTRLNFTAYWREANSNPTLAPFLAILQERYPDLAVPSAPADA
jgi:DNA-binding transcriptional LysR family regulator